MAVTYEKIDKWRRLPKTAVYFTDGSSLGNPGKVGAAALCLAPLPINPKDSAGKQSAIDMKDMKLAAAAAAAAAAKQNGKQAKQLDSKEHESSIVWTKTWSGPRDTNNVAELQAVRLVLDEIEKHPEATNVCIVSDSTYVNGVLQQGWKINRNANLIQTIKTQWKKLYAYFCSFCHSHSQNRFVIDNVQARSGIYNQNSLGTSAQENHVILEQTSRQFGCSGCGSTVIANNSMERSYFFAFLVAGSPASFCCSVFSSFFKDATTKLLLS